MLTLPRWLMLGLSLSPFGAAMFTPTARNHAQAQPVTSIFQGWSISESEDFHYAAQGSELVPYTWFLNLTEPNSDTLLKDDLTQFGVLYDPVTAHSAQLNPDHLPIGFAQEQETRKLDGIQEKRWLGFTCAACHTGAIQPQANSGAHVPGLIVIDGAPAKFNAGLFLRSLQLAVEATRTNPDKMRAFAAKVLGTTDEAATSALTASFNNYAQDLKALVPLYLPDNLAGPGRLDCFGGIFNRVCVYDVNSRQTPPAHLDAPVKFPFLWFSDRQDHIQWNGEVSNASWLDRFGRNAGEVSGVFARIDVRSLALTGYKSSIDVAGLGRIDRYVSALTPPKWAEIFPKLDPDAVSKGRDTFKHSCQTSGCHHDVGTLDHPSQVWPTPLKHDPAQGPAVLPDLDTDPNNTRLVHSASSEAGILEGSYKFFLLGPKLHAPLPAKDLVTHVVGGAVLADTFDVLKAVADYKWHRIYNPSLTVDPTDHQLSLVKNFIETWAKNASIRKYTMFDPKGSNTNTYDPYTAGYESRSLEGIWAAAPYLHNGSVPNLFELLWPEKRDPTFYVGSRVFDQKNVGFLSGPDSGGVLFDTSLPGNSNRGHTYGAELSDTEKWNLITYLKSL